LDIVRAPKPKRGRYIAIAGGLAGIIAITVALTRLEPAAPSVERATLWIDSVRRGTMVRQVRAPGTLVPEQMRYISAVTSGRIEQKLVRPGTAVTPGTILVELANPDVQLQALESDRQLAQAEAQLVQLRTNLETQRLAQRAALAQVQSAYNEAKRNAEVFAELDKKGLSSKNEVQRVNDQVRELQDRLDAERARLRTMESSVGQQLAMQQNDISRLRTIAQFQRDRVASMKVPAGESGVLQEMNLEIGQYVMAGQILARVAQPERLKGVLRVPETQAKDVAVGQPVAVDTRNGVVQGRVMRIDPAVQNGTVTVEVALDGALPKGARADLSVDAIIEIERLTDVLYVGRPAFGQAESTVGMFRLEPDEKHATRVQVKLGRSSVNTIEVVQGLNPGDKVIISDVSQWDAQERLRIK
jgi:multidrug resistance efflux pump